MSSSNSGTASLGAQTGSHSTSNIEPRFNTDIYIEFIKLGIKVNIADQVRAYTEPRSAELEALDLTSSKDLARLAEIHADVLSHVPSAEKLLVSPAVWPEIP